MRTQQRNDELQLAAMNRVKARLERWKVLFLGNRLPDDSMQADEQPMPEEGGAQPIAPVQGGEAWE